MNEERETTMEKAAQSAAEKGPKAVEPPPETAVPQPKPRAGGLRRTVLLAMLAAALVGAGVFGWRTFRFYDTHVETDDAQLEGHIDPVLPKVSGYVTAVLVDDNQKVEEGQVLLRIDDRDLRSKVATAQADLDNARASVLVARSMVTAADTTSVKTAADVERYATLRKKEEVSQQEYDAAKAAADAARSQSQASVQQISAASARVAQKQADLDFARLQLSYVTVPAPSSGYVSRKNVEVGQFVQAGQPLLAIVGDGAGWVVANFKETQLKKMKVGQPVEIEIDAYPKHPFHGKVESIAAATGAKFALLPPDNATGNFTKVVQRIPVKIVFDEAPDPARPLRAGMSVNAIVDVR
jgi:membrane fusion protein, multidrug efflux system